MKKFFYQILLFLIIPFFAGIVVFATYLYKLNITKTKLSLIAENYSVLIMGDSHMQRINPLFIKEKACNMATSGEHYFYTYSKLTSIIENKNCKIKTIIIGISPHNFAPIYQKLYDINTIEGKTSLKKYLFFTDLLHCNEYNLWDFMKCNFFYSGVFYPPEWGGLYSSEISNPPLTVILHTLQQHYDNEKANDPTLQLFYLSKIINACTDKGIKVVGVSTPVHSEYRNRMPQHYLNLSNQVVSNFGHKLLYIDYFSYQMGNDFFSDGDHINNAGAKIITVKIDSIIRASN